MRRAVGWARERTRRLVLDESGEATIEFIGLVLLLVVPIVYLVVALAQVQAALFAAEGGAREAARVLAEDPSDRATALGQIELAFEDFHVDSAPATRIGCRSCGRPVTDVEVVVSTSVPLPLLPGRVGARFALPVSATAVSLVEGVGLDG